MACILKQGKNIVSPFDNKANLSFVYMVIEQQETDTTNHSASFIINMYGRTCTKNERRTDIIKPMLSLNCESSTQSDFDTYFSPTAIANDKDQYHQSYLWFLSQIIPPEHKIVGETSIVWSDLLQSDE